MSTNSTTDDTGPNYLKIAIYVGVLLAIAVGTFFLPVQDWAKAYKSWLDDLGWIGMVAYVIIYVIATSALVPGAILTLAGGLAYGLWAFPLVVIGATGAAAVSFLAARYLVRDKVVAAMEKYPKFKAVDAAIQEEGWKVVALMRLSPALPFSIQNWFMGTTSVKFVPHISATAFAIMPGTLLYVWIGSLGATAASGEDTSIAKYVFFGVGVVATLAVTILVGRKAKQKLEVKKPST